MLLSFELGLLGKPLLNLLTFLCLVSTYPGSMINPGLQSRNQVAFLDEKNFSVKYPLIPKHFLQLQKVIRDFNSGSIASVHWFDLENTSVPYPIQNG